MYICCLEMYNYDQVFLNRHLQKQTLHCLNNNMSYMDYKFPLSDSLESLFVPIQSYRHTGVCEGCDEPISLASLASSPWKGSRSYRAYSILGSLFKGSWRIAPEGFLFSTNPPCLAGLNSYHYSTKGVAKHK